ncbi:MAG TPA: ABC transporter permease [Candidatus Acidoferrum sp.]|nr:ABC transporter permease [Candidatus Acidoferrum sp.]
MSWQNWIYTVPLRLRSLLRREEVERELDEEMRYHLERKTEECVAAGLTPAEARHAAMRAMDGIERQKEECRDMRKVNWLEDFLQDLRYAARMLRRNPGFAAVVVLTLALGIGANTAIFSVIDGILLRPLPYGDADRLVIVWENNLRRSYPQNVASPPNFLDWQTQNHVFSGMSCLSDLRGNLTGSGDPEQIVTQYVSANFFSILGVNPILGPGFTAENGEDGKDKVVVLSYGLWKRRFAGDPGIVGKTIELNGKILSVVGVMPEKFNFFIKQGTLTGEKPQLWSPWVLPAAYHQRKNSGRFMTVVARLQPRVTKAQAQTEMTAIATRLAQEYPDFDGHWGATVVGLREQISGELRPALLLLLGAVGFVLLIACANVSSLLLARAAGREREMGIRTAIGASRWRMARQLLTESVLLAMIGGGVGIALAVWGTNLLLAASPANLLALQRVPIDWRVLAFACGITLFAGLLFGFLPSYISSRSAIAETLKEGGRSASAGRQRRTVRSAFVVAQIGMALVLLAGSGLLMRSFALLLGVNPGFDAKNLLTFTVTLPSARYATDAAQLAFFRQLEERMAKIPGMRSASMESFPPMAGLGAATSVRILSQPARAASDLPVAAVRVVGRDYLRTMGIPLHAGREFDTRELAEMRHVALVNQAFVDRYFAGAVNPLGQKIVVYMKSDEESESQPSEIIGVIGDVRLVGLDAPVEPTVYWPHPELVYSRMTILARTSSDPMSIVSPARNELREMDPNEPMASVATVEELLSDSFSRSRFTMIVLGVFAGAALLLAAVGIYGVVAYTVAQRTNEIGIRVAMGAQRRDVLRLVLGQGSRLIFLGVGLGVAAGLLMTRLMTGLLYGISATDPLTFAGVALLLTAVALVACCVPARRAMRVDPLVALRYE